VWITTNLIVDIVANLFCPETCKRNPVVCCRRPKSVGTARKRRLRWLRQTVTFGDLLDAVVACYCVSVASDSVATVKLVLRDLRIFGRLTVWIRIRRRTGTSGKCLSHCTLRYLNITILQCYCVIVFRCRNDVRNLKKNKSNNDSDDIAMTMKSETSR